MQSECAALRVSDEDKRIILEIKDAVLKAERVVIVSHRRPDGDAVGSAMGLLSVLKAAGIRAVCAAVAPISDTYRFMEGLSEIIPEGEYARAAGDLIMVLDCAGIGRPTESLQPFLAQPGTICIDHHKSNPGFGDICWLDASASSTAEMMARFVYVCGFPMTQAAAEAFWTGVVTDTGRFAYDSTSPETLHCAAYLKTFGVRSDMIDDYVYSRVELRKLRLQRRLLQNLEIEADGKIAVVSLSPDDYAAEHCTALDSENFVDLARSVKGIKLAVFMRADTPGVPVNISLRTYEPYDASEICAKWGGGGHARAAGAALPGDVAEVRARVIRDLVAVVETAEAVS